MARARLSRPRAAAPAPPPRRPAAPVALAAAAAVAAASLVVFRGALDYGFSQDDFAGLARASGLLPRLEGPWRLLSHQLAFDALAGRDPRVHHALSLALVALLSGTVTFLLARRFALPAALLGGAFLASSPNLFTAVYWFSAHGDVAAALFATLALAAALARGPARWSAVPLFAIALMWKESVVALPVAVAAFTARARRAPPWRDPVVLALVAVAAAFAAEFVLGRRFGVGAPGGASRAYALGGPGDALANLLTYVGWSLPAPAPLVTGFSDAVEPRLFVPAAVALAALVAGALAPRLRERGWIAGGIAGLAMLAPVLALAHHTYHYYLTAALPAAAFLIAAAADAAIAAPAARRAAATMAMALAVALVVNGAVLVRRIEHAPFAIAGLRADPTVDRALVAARIAEGVRAASLPPGTRLALWSPQSLEAGAAGRYAAANVRAALLDGLAVRVMAPAVDSVAFVEAFDGRGDPWRWGVYRPDGRVRVGTAGEIAAALAVRSPAPPAP